MGIEFTVQSGERLEDDVVVDVDAVLQRSGESRSINGGAPQLYNGPITLAQGRYVITYWAVDGAGNVEPADTIMIDVTGRTP